MTLSMTYVGKDLKACCNRISMPKIMKGGPMRGE